MNFLVTELSTALQALGQPVNLVAVLFGTLAGLWLTPVLRRARLDNAATLVLALPVASLLDPVAALMLLGAIYAATLEAGVEFAHGASRLHATALTLLAGVAGAIVVVLASNWAAAWLQDVSSADKVALLLIGAAVAPLIAAAARPVPLLVALALTVAGIAAQMSRWAPLDSEHASPLPVLLGLAVLGPALATLIRPARVGSDVASSTSVTEPLATALPGFLVGAPVTLGAAVLALNLAENGLQLGPQLTAQRPKLVLGFFAAVILAALLAACARWLGRALSHWMWSHNLGPALLTRLAAIGVSVLAALALYRDRTALDQNSEVLGLDLATTLSLVVATILGAAAAFAGFDLAPLIVGLVIGQLLLPALTASLEAADGNIGSALASGSKPLLALALIAVAVTLCWPLLARRARATP